MPTNAIPTPAPKTVSALRMCDTFRFAVERAESKLYTFVPKMQKGPPIATCYSSQGSPNRTLRSRVESLAGHAEQALGEAGEPAARTFLCRVNRLGGSRQRVVREPTVVGGLPDLVWAIPHQ